VATVWWESLYLIVFAAVTWLPVARPEKSGRHQHYQQREVLSILQVFSGGEVVLAAWSVSMVMAVVIQDDGGSATVHCEQLTNLRATEGDFCFLSMTSYFDFVLLILEVD